MFDNQGDWKESRAGQFGNLVNWDSEGVILEGIYEGQHEGKYGMLLDVSNPHGFFSASCTIMLVQKLESIPVGSEIRITFTGYLKTKNGHNLKDFEVLYRPLEHSV